MLVKAIQKFPSLKDLIPSLNQNKIYDSFFKLIIF